jgi:hypothetical protein
MQPLKVPLSHNGTVRASKLRNNALDVDVKPTKVRVLVMRMRAQGGCQCVSHNSQIHWVWSWEAWVIRPPMGCEF